jgi:hypothetical protein
MLHSFEERGGNTPKRTGVHLKLQLSPTAPTAEELEDNVTYARTASLRRGSSAGRRTTTSSTYAGERKMDSVGDVEHVTGKEMGVGRMGR